MRNLGPKSREWLSHVGLSRKEDIRSIGAVAAYKQVKEKHPEVTLNLLWALQAMLLDMDWRDLPVDVKERLKKEL
jgi:DNA transformation protein and related proteins